MRKIPSEELSGVFRDAIDVTRKAGIKYLWIDSLCIVQNSSIDWEVESQKMGDIYQNATFNIAATGFTDGSRGLFVQRDPGLVDPVQLQLKRAFDVVGTSNPQPGVYRLVEMSTWIEGVEHAPLNYRGWVIQERYLSPRILHFGARQLYWECATSQRCESSLKGLNKWVNTYDATKSSSLRERLSWGVKKQDGQSSSSLDHWVVAVDRFSRSEITFPSDKLVALSGLARTLHDESLGSYMGGLWSEDIIHQLTWEVKGDRQRERPKDYRCPSWSWASIDSRVTSVYFKKWASLASLLEVATIPESDDDFGPLIGGHLKLLCQLICVEVSDPTGKYEALVDFPLERCLSGRGLIMDDINPLDEEVIPFEVPPLSNRRLRLVRSLEVWQPNHLLIAPMAIRQGNCWHPIRSLALKPTHRYMKGGVFKRVGVFDTDEDNEVLQKIDQNLPESLCGTRQENGRYEITII